MKRIDAVAENGAVTTRRFTAAWALWVLGWSLAVGGVVFVTPTYFVFGQAAAYAVAGIVTGLSLILATLSVSAERVVAEDDARFQARLRDLSARFGREAAQLIVLGEPWQGATEAMIIETLGEPDAITADAVIPTSKWLLYTPRDTSDYPLRVQVSAGVVISWDRGA